MASILFKQELQVEGQVNLLLLLQGKNVQKILRVFGLFGRIWASKIKEDAAQSCPMGLSADRVGSDGHSLTVIN